MSGAAGRAANGEPTAPSRSSNTELRCQVSVNPLMDRLDLHCGDHVRGFDAAFVDQPLVEFVHTIDKLQIFRIVGIEIVSK